MVLFLISFLANTIAGVGCCLTRLFRRRQSVALPASNRVVNLKRAIGALNLLILVTFSITVLLVVDQMHPSCPSVLLFVPLLGTVSTLATVTLLIVLARTPRDPAGRQPEESASHSMFFVWSFLSRTCSTGT